VDLYSPITKQVYQFQGCFVHCHLPPQCKDAKRQHLEFDTATNIYNKSAAAVQKEHDKFCEFLFSKYSEDVKTIKFVYECDWKIFKKTDKRWKDFLESSNFNPRRPLHKLIPRIAMRSGLLEQYKLMWSKKNNPSECFRISDINAMYAHITLNYKFGVGKPIIIIGDELKHVVVKEKDLFYNDQKMKSGQIHCSIIAPQNEATPYLQFRVANKFNFNPVCRMCSVNLRTKCLHRLETSKAFTSIWTLIDVRKALRENYVITNIYEVHFFPVRKYLLRPFVQCLSSLRIQNSGGLDNLKTLDEKQTYCKMHNDKMQLPSSFALNENNVIRNDTKKALYKNLSNSFFGKFSQNLQNTKTEIVRSQHRLEEIASTYEIIDIYELTNSSLSVEYSRSDIRPNRKGNVYLGSEITAHARVLLFDYIRLLQAEKGITVYGCDTDCLFYSIDKDSIDPLKFSDLLGDFKSVLPSDCEIVSFHSLGCRNYSILFKDAENNLNNIIKVKGLSLKSKHLENPLSPQIYEEFLQANFENELKALTLPQIRKCKTKLSTHLETKLTTFEFKNHLFMKRFLNKTNRNYETLPYGFKEKPN